jgi:hypothetical protein
LSSPILPSNQLVFCAFLSSELMERLNNAVMGAYKKLQSDKIVLAFNYLITQYCKLYEIGSKSP